MSSSSSAFSVGASGRGASHLGGCDDSVSRIRVKELIRSALADPFSSRPSKSGPGNWQFGLRLQSRDKRNNVDLIEEIGI
jgi:hypothetical protein